MWVYAESGDSVADEAFLYNESNVQTMQEYHDAIATAYDSFESIDETEIRELSGYRFLRSFSRRYLEGECLEIETSEEGFVIKTGAGHGHEAHSSTFFTIDRFCQIEEFLRDQMTTAFSVRIDKAEIEVVATRISPDRIRIERR